MRLPLFVLTRLFASCLFAAGTAQAQINELPNPDFEQWTDFAPVDYGAFQPPQLFWRTVFQSSDAASGQFAVRLRTVAFSGQTFNGGLFSCTIGDCRTPPDDDAALYFPVSLRYTNLCGQYQGAPVGGDKLFVSLALLQGGTVIGGTDAGTSQGAFLTEPQDRWTPFNMPITYLPGVGDSVRPDQAILELSNVGPTFPQGDPATFAGSVGTEFAVDDLYFCDAASRPAGPGSGSRGDALLLLDDAGAPSAGDVAVRTLLQTLGLAVDLRSDEAALAEDATGRALVVVSGSVDPAALTADYAQADAPVVLWEPGLYSRMGLTQGTPDADYGATAAQTAMSVVDAAHPIAQGFAGEAVVYTQPLPLTFGQPASSARVVAEGDGRPTLFTYDAGAALVGGASAPARRVGFFVHDDNLGALATDGQVLLENAVLWALGREAEISRSVDVEEVGEGRAAGFRLDPNRPNPFQQATTLSYTLDRPGPVRLAVYNLLGQEVARLVEGARAAGIHAATFDASALPSGVYLVRLEAAGQVRTRLVMLQR